MSQFNPQTLLQPHRKITGMSAILLPFLADATIDWDGLKAHLLRTWQAGLTPAVNMDTGYANLIDEATRERVLDITQSLAEKRPFVAGAPVNDQTGDPFAADSSASPIAKIVRHGGTPIIFQSFGLTALANDKLVEAYATFGQHCDRFIAFELGQMFAPFGKIYDLDTYATLLQIPQCIGAKHSSLNRELEWQRLRLRNQRRPDFMVLTGNDLAIDMVMYGSDYLLGISTFAPDLFAQRDALWAAGDAHFYELNDWLQYLGFFAFRAPVPAYKHSAAQFLKLRGWIASDTPHPLAQRRPQSDIPTLNDIVEHLQLWSNA